MSTVPTDRELLEWLQDQIVDTIYLDDGRIIDVRGGDVRKAIAEKMREAPGAGVEGGC